MADEIRTNDTTEGTDANTVGSFTPQQNQNSAPSVPTGGAASLPEPVILEEHVVAPETKAPDAPQTPVAPAAQASQPKPPASPLTGPEIPAPNSQPASRPSVSTESVPMTIVPPSGLGNSTQPVAAEKELLPPTPPVVPTAPVETSNVTEEVSPKEAVAEEPKKAIVQPTPIVTAIPKAEGPKADPEPPTPVVSTMPGTAEERNSRITGILSKIKLPERRGPNAKKKEGPKTVPDVTKLQKDAERIPAAPAAPEAAAPHVEKTPGEEKNSERTSIVQSVHTLKDDLQKVVRVNKISLVKAAALEEQKKQGQEHLVPKAKPARASARTHGILFVSGLLIILGALAFAGVYYAQQQKTTNTQTPPSQLNSILFAENTVTFPLDNQSPIQLKELLAKARDSSIGTLGSITRILPIQAATSSVNAPQTPVTLQQFFTALGITPPDELMRAIGPDFFFGVHSADVEAPLFVIPVTSYDHAFAGMLAWEPSMDQDLQPMFTAVPALTTGADGLPVARQFVDGILLNYDVRELKDDQGKIVLYYSFPTPKLLVIAQSPYSFTEILSRLQAERKL